MWSFLDLERPSKDELLGRIEKLRKKMKEMDIDFSLILHNVDIFYFTGSMQKSVLVVPKKDEILFFVEKSTERVKMESPFDFLKGVREKEIVNVIEGRGIFKGRCGMEFDVLPVSLFEKWKKLLQPIELVDISHLIREIRMIKSEYEIEQIKKSGMIVDKVFEKAKEIIREGMTELEIGSILEAQGRSLGHHGFLRMRGFNNEMMNIYVTQGASGVLPASADVPISGVGITPAIPQGPSMNSIQKHIPVLIDYGAGYNGYITDETRIFVIGKMDEAFKRPYEVAREIVEDTLSYGKEGVNGKELFLRAFNKVKREGLEEYFMGFGEGKVAFIGHGLGLEINELPVITPRHNITLKEGMVFAFEPKFVIPSKGVIGIEVDLVVRKDGLERVSNTPIEIFYL